MSIAECFDRTQPLYVLTLLTQTSIHAVQQNDSGKPELSEPHDKIPCPFLGPTDSKLTFCQLERNPNISWLITIHENDLQLLRAHCATPFINSGSQVKSVQCKMHNYRVWFIFNSSPLCRTLV
ncbi:hypothetical protein ABZP36_024631 [Zizania latifolia]